MRILAVVFEMVFVGELLMRIAGSEGEFVAGSDWRWNAFDTVVVLTSVAELFILELAFSPSFVRIFRMARLVRSLRVLRLMRFTSWVAQLRFLTLAVVHCRTMLMWAVFFLILVVFFFAVIFLDAVASYIEDASDTDVYVEEMGTFFGSLPMSMLTLIMAVLGGLDWWDVVRLLLEISVGYLLIFLLYVIITFLAIMNVISAIFVNDAMETASMDMDLRMKNELDKTRITIETLTSVFQDMCEHDGYSVAPSEFASHMERQEMKLFCASFGLYFTDLYSLFKSLDIDGNGLLSIDEFVIGFLRLRGGSILIEMEVSLKETKSMVKTLSQNVQALTARRADSQDF